MPAAVLSASLLWFPRAAPVTSSVEAAARSVFGVFAYVLPIFMVVAAVEFLREGGRPLRVSVSLMALLVGISIVWSLGSDNPSAAAGGVIAATAANALASRLGRPAAYVSVISASMAVVWIGLGIPLWQPAAAAVARVERKIGERAARRRKEGLDVAKKDHLPTQDAGVGPSPAPSSFKPRPDTEEPASAAEVAEGGTSRVPERVGGQRLRPTKAGRLELGLGDGRSGYPGTSFALPSLALLREGPGRKRPRGSLEEIGRVLVETLRQFDVDATLSGITPGPTVTRFEVELAPGVKVAKVKGLSDDIAYALASESVRIQAPIPGKSAIGIEIPNRERRLVTVGDVLGSAAGRAASHPLDCALGKDISGKPVLINLADMPHLLIAGTTGGGKSSTINALVTSLIVRNGPEQVRLLLVDPKRVELGVYDGIPHLLTHVVTNAKRASEGLAWVVREMEVRYEKLAEVGARDIAGYNSMVSAQGGIVVGEAFEHRVMGFIVVVVDELNDLMMVAARDVEDSIMRLAQMARAVGIHLVVATQRPSTNVITGVIKANIPSRIAFRVGSQVDSRVILDTGGAEDLVGMGDMLLLTASSGVPTRIQGCFVSEEEVRKVVAHWRRLVPTPEYLDGSIFSAPEADAAAHEDDDELLEQATDLVVRTQLGSTSMLQRKLRVGFARAGRLMDLLERRGVVGPPEGSRARAVLVSVEEYENFRSRRSIDHGNHQH